MKKLSAVCVFLVAALAAALFFGVRGMTGSGAAPEVDLDLTRLSSTMAYAALLNVVTEPEAYVGKMIKINGLFGSFQDRDGNIYCGVTLMDPTACCASGLDCVLKSEYEYPKDYPAIGADVTIAGRFEVHRSGKRVAHRLVDAEVL